MQTYNLNVFDLEITFRTEADEAQVNKACAYVESLYAQLKNHGSHLGRDRLLTLLILGIADDVLQLRQQEAQTQERLNNLLQRIECDKV